VRDPGHRGGGLRPLPLDRYRVGDTDPVASGRAEQPAEARSRAEGALGAYAEGAGLVSGSGAID
jgi:hypothetical protein